MLNKLLKQATQKLKKQGKTQEADEVTAYLSQSESKTSAQPAAKVITPITPNKKKAANGGNAFKAVAAKAEEQVNAPQTEVKAEEQSKNQAENQTESGEENQTQDNEESSVYEQYQQLLDRLRETDKKYSTEYNAPTLTTPATLGTQRVDYVAPSQQELYEMAKESLAAKYLADEQKIKAAQTEREQKLAQQRKETEFAAMLAKQEAQRELPQQLEAAHNKTLKQGIARSSIADGLQQQQQNIHDEQMREIEQQQAHETQLIQLQLEDAKAATAQALSALAQQQDAQTVAEVTELLNDVNKKLEEAAKYNNSLAAAESKYQITRYNALTAANKEERQRLNDIVELYTILGAAGVMQKAELEKFAAARSFFDRLDKATALSLLTSSQEMKHYLGDYYETLLQYVNSK